MTTSWEAPLEGVMPGLVGLCLDDFMGLVLCASRGVSGFSSQSLISCRLHMKR